MAKINHNNYLDTIDQVLTNAGQKGLLFLETTGEQYNGKFIEIKGRKLLNFGTCGYLGLESDPRLIEGAIEYAERYGTQFSVSRTYLNANYNLELEDLIKEIYGFPVIIQSSTSTCHISAIPSLVREQDAVILDQAVHFSVNTACQLLRQKGITIDMIRHNHIEMLERKINELKQKHQNIWYMIDGVYSMYGELAPVKELLELQKIYPQLYLYVDDAHGMSWYGKNGSGYFFDSVGLNDRIVLVTTLAKGFGTTGGIIIFPNQEIFHKVRVFGGPLTYSHPIPPAGIGAAIASANIHLSDEICEMQQQLKNNIDYCNKLLSASSLPVFSHPLTPIYFIGMGKLKVGHSLVNRIIREGFYVNLSLFPAVPVQNTGLRFTLTRHQNKAQIARLVEAITYHFPLALKEENVSREEILKAFQKITPEKVKPFVTEKNKFFSIQYEKTIEKIDASLWDDLFASYGSFDWQNLFSLEMIFAGNKKPEQNWDFHYFIVRDQDNKIVVATFFISGIFKDDFLSLEGISKQIEEKRKEDPYYLSSYSLIMGSLLTEGQHLYCDRSHPRWKEALKLLLKEVDRLQFKIEANMVTLRDFDKHDRQLKELFLNEGYIVADMPNTNVIESVPGQYPEEYLETLSAKNRKNVRQEALRFEDRFDIEIKKQVTEEESKYYYRLFLNVKRRNLAVNFYDYPENIIQELSYYPGWEFLVLFLKKEYDQRPERLPVTVCWCYRTKTAYCPMILGMDYNFAFEHRVYKQVIHQLIKRAKKLNLDKIYLGLSADTDKKKFGAKQIPKVAYVQARDPYHMEVIASMAAL